MFIYSFQSWNVVDIYIIVTNECRHLQFPVMECRRSWNVLDDLGMFSDTERFSPRPEFFSRVSSARGTAKIWLFSAGFPPCMSSSFSFISHSSTSAEAVRRRRDGGGALGRVPYYCRGIRGRWWLPTGEVLRRTTTTPVRSGRSRGPRRRNIPRRCRGLKILPRRFTRDRRRQKIPVPQEETMRARAGPVVPPSQRSRPSPITQAVSRLRTIWTS